MIETATGPHFGLVEDFTRVAPEPDDLPLAVFAARLGNTGAFARSAAPVAASGAALDEAGGAAACLGEAVERYAAALPRPGAVVRARAGELPGRAVAPAGFALFSAAQYARTRPTFPFRPWVETDAIGWTEARSLASGERVWVPAGFVFQPHEPEEGEPLLAPSLSTGLACAGTWEEAAAHGLREAIERDAVALAWLGQVTPRRVAGPPAGAGEIGTLARLLDARGFTWALFDLTTDLDVPVAAALLQGRSPVGSVVSFGSACHPDPARAMAKAVIEAAHGRMYVKSIVRSTPRWRAGRRFENVTSFAEHARFYTSHPEHLGALERWFQAPLAPPAPPRGAPRAPEPSPAAWLDATARELAAAGHEVLAADLTPPDVADLGWKVARVIVPGLQPLHGHHAWPHLGGRRLRELERVFGPAARAPRRWNPYPHPCP